MSPKPFTPTPEQIAAEVPKTIAYQAEPRFQLDR